MTVVDGARERARTPGCASGHHLNSAGAALPSAETLDTVIDYLRLEASTGGYETARGSLERIERTYESIAELAGCAADEVALMDSATRAWQTAIASLRLKAGDRVIVTRSEYVSNALMLLTLEREVGIVVDVIGTAADGTVDLVELESRLQLGDAALVAIGHIPTFSGLVEPVVAIGELTRRYGVPFVLDATQSLGQLPLHVDLIGCDILVSTGRKYLRAPRGTGLLIVRRPLLDRLEPWVPDVRGAEWNGERTWELRESARRFETFEHSPALRLGLGAAVDHALELGIDAIAERIGDLGAELRGRLLETAGVEIADPPAAAGGTVTFTIEGQSAQAVVAHLAKHDVYVVSVPASHGQWELGRREVDAVVRASVHVYNDERDFAALTGALEKLPVRAQA
ncbi:MAG TPA: aminotransferase class V-fold PLP-dependent enzyme [Solirubrobacteraceae bacterium]|nr:aminotransferase class V-fold PLP-dependent enzyme [Solirubrobacteraceae bacterium]